MNAEVKTEFDTATDLLQLVTFKLGNEEFGLDIIKVKEINKMINVTSIPSAPAYIKGVINLRGNVIPVVDLRTRLTLPNKEYDQATRIIVVELEERTIGFIVDEVCEVLRIPRGITEAPPEMVGGIDSEFITAVGKLDDRLIILMDLKKLFIEEMVV